MEGLVDFGCLVVWLFGCLVVWLLFFVFIILLFGKEREMMFSFKTRLACTWRNFSGVCFPYDLD